MPYIKQERRHSLITGESLAKDKGELNFCLSILMAHYVDMHGASYQNISDAIGAAQDAADEMRRRVLHPYEDTKIEENGDIYENILSS